MTEREAQAEIQELQVLYPVLDICTGVWGDGSREWVARNYQGHPWLIMSGSLERFKSMLRAACV